MDKINFSAGTFIWPIRVYYEDTDAGGIVYYANYLKFLERARTEWLRSLGIEQDTWLTAGVAFVVRQVQLDLRLPARFNELLQVHSEMTRVGRASVEFEQWVLGPDQQVICSATVKAACVSLATADKPMKATPMPVEIVEELKRAS
ncbi:acyl-CoA thioester hydrolase [Pseudidiomarina planktonica]|uniref:Acyl-CoA thioester hydrolase n=1 Tax=Pseudidiomarina planktonica TaxID=1323738 RepID=A0A1Y6EK28_9GAMM|nr:tol-pal system-associated acyl-CoA thioesterase [Pseudidiomarina planktonica]RUO65794.1 tol-pal system-associated acyl-CoA thioesterase [Pseudidiomarina planktonica]SMQ62726.1 acyl-CoA thioester hydrolase [Pseudidiomarina planktonica]